VFRIAGGTPRVVNLVCDRALYRGYLVRKSVIDVETVTQAIEDLGVGALTPLPASMAAPAIQPVAPDVTRPEPTPPVAGPAPLLRDSAPTDLSGLEVHDIGESVHAPATITTPVYKTSIFGKKRPRSRLRWRLLRWAATAVGVACIVFVALLGEAVFIHYFPSVADQDLRLPAPAPLRIPATAGTISIPSDVTQRPPLPDPVRLEPGALPARE
jgi:hypothetical protein